jgi:hypothetical protein
MRVVEHIAHVHCSVTAYTQDFVLKLRRNNYVTPKHYVDFIHTYLNLLDEKNDCIKSQVKEERAQEERLFTCPIYERVYCLS